LSLFRRAREFPSKLGEDLIYYRSSIPYLRSHAGYLAIALGRDRSLVDATVGGILERFEASYATCASREIPSRTLMCRKVKGLWLLLASLLVVKCPFLPLPLGTAFFASSRAGVLPGSGLWVVIVVMRRRSHRHWSRLQHRFLGAGSDLVQAASILY
jgi:hypothetical protein